MRIIKEMVAREERKEGGGTLNAPPDCPHLRSEVPRSSYSSGLDAKIRPGPTPTLSPPSLPPLFPCYNATAATPQTFIKAGSHYKKKLNSVLFAIKGKQIELLKGLPPLRFFLFFRKAFFCLRAIERKGFFTSVYGAFFPFLSKWRRGGGSWKGHQTGDPFFSASFYHALLAYWVYGDTGDRGKDGGGG